MLVPILSMNDGFLPMSIIKVYPTWTTHYPNSGTNRRGGVMAMPDKYLYSGIKVLYDGWGLGPDQYYACGHPTTGGQHSRLWSTVGYEDDYQGEVFSASR